MIVASYCTHLLERVLVTSHTAIARKHQRNQHAYATPAQHVLRFSPVCPKAQVATTSNEDRSKSGGGVCSTKEAASRVRVAVSSVGRAQQRYPTATQVTGSSCPLLTLAEKECLGSELQQFLPACASFVRVAAAASAGDQYLWQRAVIYGSWSEWWCVLMHVRGTPNSRHQGRHRE